MMTWLLEGMILVVVGALLRRVLRIDDPSRRLHQELTPLGCARARVFDGLAEHVQTNAGILAVVLNQAMEEGLAGNSELAWGLVQLGASQWGRLAGTVLALLSQMSKYLPVAAVYSPVRRMRPERFKSEKVIDCVSVHQALTQFVLHSRLRFQLHLRLLRRAVELLTAEFWLLNRTAERLEARPLEFWGRLDFYFHDLDLLSKETLLALHALFHGLSESEIKTFGADFHAQFPKLEPLDNAAVGEKTAYLHSGPHTH